MPFLVTAGSQIKCSLGLAPAVLSPTPNPATATTPTCTVADFKPNVNIPPFGMCTSPSNPQVAAATAAAQGVLTPQPCLPNVTTPWTPGSTTVTVNGLQTLTNTSTCACAWAGVISIVASNQVGAQVL